MKITAKSLTLLILIFATTVKAGVDPEKFRIVKSSVREVSKTGIEKGRGQNNIWSLDEIPSPDPIETAGKVIGVAKDMVALGEDFYTLVIKGKPTNTTTYAPISVVPKDGAQIVDVLEMEGWSVPVQKTFEAQFFNAYNVAVVTFRYSVMYSYNGSYQGKGAYLTSVQIIPDYVRTLFGFDFTATMKLGGVQNQGKNGERVAGATLLVEYTVSSVMNKINRTDKYFVTGKGELKKYQK